MTKFLKLCEQYDPSNQDVQDAALWIKQVLSEADVPFSGDGDEIRIPTEYGVAVLKVVAFEKDEEVAHEEDEQINAGIGTYEVDKEVENLGSKAESGAKGMVGKVFGTAAQRAKSAIKKRQRLAKQAVDVYDAGTKRLEQGLRNARTSFRSTPTTW